MIYRLLIVIVMTFHLGFLVFYKEIFVITVWTIQPSFLVIFTMTVCMQLLTSFQMALMSFPLVVVQTFLSFLENLFFPRFLLVGFKPFVGMQMLTSFGVLPDDGVHINVRAKNALFRQIAEARSQLQALGREFTLLSPQWMPDVPNSTWRRRSWLRSRSPRRPAALPDDLWSRHCAGASLHEIAHQVTWAPRAFGRNVFGGMREW
ncbi:unnamed protein product, partial [Prorocentrum cordatum]